MLSNGSGNGSLSGLLDSNKRSHVNAVEPSNVFEIPLNDYICSISHKAFQDFSDNHGYGIG